MGDAWLVVLEKQSSLIISPDLIKTIPLLCHNSPVCDLTKRGDNVTDCASVSLLFGAKVAFHCPLFCSL